MLFPDQIISGSKKTPTLYRFTELTLYRFTELSLYKFTEMTWYRFTELTLYRFTERGRKKMFHIRTSEDVIDEKLPVISCHSEHHCMYHYRFKLKVSSRRLFKLFFLYSTCVENRPAGHRNSGCGLSELTAPVTVVSMCDVRGDRPCVM